MCGKLSSVSKQTHSDILDKSSNLSCEAHGLLLRILLLPETKIQNIPVFRIVHRAPVIHDVLLDHFPDRLESTSHLQVLFNTTL
jgi:hypothetical protein